MDHRTKKTIKQKIGHLPTVFDRVSPELLAAMPYEYPGKPIDITITTDEFTCLCPWSGLPDFADLTIIYTPKKTVIELKSLKYYLHSFRQVGMVHESVVNRIKDDLLAAIKPLRLTVELKFNTRGGISTAVRASFGK